MPGTKGIAVIEKKREDKMRQRKGQRECCNITQYAKVSEALPTWEKPELCILIQPHLSPLAKEDHGGQLDSIFKAQDIWWISKNKTRKEPLIELVG